MGTLFWSTCTANDVTRATAIEKLQAPKDEMANVETENARYFFQKTLFGIRFYLHSN